MNRTTVAVVAVLAILGGAAWFHLSSTRAVRLEISTASGTVGRIQWRAGNADEQSTAGRIPTPWSTTLTVKRISTVVTVAALSRSDDVVTCRITIDGEQATESTTPEAAGCAATLT